MCRVKNSPYHNYVSCLKRSYHCHIHITEHSGTCLATVQPFSFPRTSSASLQREEATVSEPSNTSGNRTRDVGQAGKQEVEDRWGCCAKIFVEQQLRTNRPASSPYLQHLEPRGGHRQVGEV